MLNLNTINETISKYYDCEMNESELLSYEARLVNSDYIKDYTNQKCFEFYKITNSINQVKAKIKRYSGLLCDEILNKNSEKLFLNFYPVFLKRFYKKLCRLSLNALRDNSK